jgi:small subunit ribosomal protein S4
MGHPRRLKKKWMGPKKRWDKERIIEEKKLMEDYGLKNKKELWKAKTIIRKYRHIARSLVGLPEDERAVKEEELLNKMRRMGLLSEDNLSLDAVLGLRVEDLLERRLQTIVYKKGLARTIKQARQFIVHGHIRVGEKRVRSPGHIVTVEEEPLVDWYREPIITDTGEASVSSEPQESSEQVMEHG